MSLRDVTPLGPPWPGPVVEPTLAQALATATDAIEGVQPILRHLLGARDRALFSDRIVAQVRSLLHDLGRQLAAGLVTSEDGTEPPGSDEGRRLGALVAAITADPSLLAHVHAIALEARLGERLDDRIALDPVLSPLLNSLMASPDPATSSLAEALFASQTAFVQAQQRGELPLGELPGDLCHSVLITVRAHFGAGDPVNDARAAALGRAVRAQAVEVASRVRLLDRLVAQMGPGAIAALDIAHAGVALFATALGLGSGQDRDAAILTTSESQVPRLVLALLASGLDPAAAERQVNLLHPGTPLPPDLVTVGADRAAALLAKGR